jgi:hypothetical protein
LAGAFLLPLNQDRCNMTKQLFFVSILVVTLASCNNKTIPNTDIDVARAFIRDVMDNNFTDAQPLMLADDMNQGYMDVTKRKLGSFGQAELDSYKNADIIFNTINNVNDSVTIINYSNSYKRNSPDKVKMVRVNGKWLVDLKYTFTDNK